MMAWLFSFAAAFGRPLQSSLRQLAGVARAKAQREDAVRRAQHKREWATWLNGDTPRAAGAPTALTKRAFLYVKGTAGWMRSPTAAADIQDDVPYEETPVPAAGACQWRPEAQEITRGAKIPLSD